MSFFMNSLFSLHHYLRSSSTSDLDGLLQIKVTTMMRSLARPTGALVCLQLFALLVVIQLIGAFSYTGTFFFHVKYSYALRPSRLSIVSAFRFHI